MIRFCGIILIAVFSLIKACTPPTEDSPSRRVRQFTHSYFHRKWDAALVHCTDAARSKILNASSFERQLPDIWKEPDISISEFYVKDSIPDSTGTMIYDLVLLDRDATGGFQESLFRITLKNDSGGKISNYQFIRSDYDIR
ncbi:hypothetical protein L6Q79_10325 [bacterium]|nr:hypothetical protein [bacterium]NUN45927.1 hypothetical protein [bacterium]